jgi:ethanolamine ammonia-lyase large subunit
MLNYQSTSYHDALYLRQALGLRPAPEFEAWLVSLGLLDPRGRIRGQADVRLASERLLELSGPRPTAGAGKPA